MKSIDVVAALIIRDGKVLATQRGYGDFEDGWEFPGGKVEPGETPEQAVVREIEEELAAHVTVRSHFTTVEHDYDDFHMVLRCYVCMLDAGEHLTLLEHKAILWLDANDLDAIPWTPADRKVAAEIKRAHLIA